MNRLDRFYRNFLTRCNSCALRWTTVALLAVIVVGCRNQEQITVVDTERTELPRQELDAEAARGQLDHMFAAIVPHGDKAWFFKVVASGSSAEEAGAAFDGFISTVSLDGVSQDAKTPNWELPEGWESETATGMRDATITMPVGESTLEVTVSSLPLGDDWTAFLTANVNRWLNQLGQAPLDAKAIESLVKTHSIDGGKATTVELLGAFSQPMMGGQMPAGHPPVGPAPTSQAFDTQSSTGQSAQSAGQASEEFAFAAPTAWTSGRQSAMRKASFAAEGGVDVSVTAFPNRLQMGDLGVNLQRWAGEVGFVAPDDQELVDLAEPIVVGELDGHLVWFAGDQRATLAAMIPRGDEVWFFKLTGPTEAVQLQHDGFRSFLGSVEFRQP